MSKKNTSVSISIPVYEIQGQLDFIKSVCQDFEFDVDKLITLILADWIATFQEGCCSCGNPANAFLSYLKSADNTFSKLKKIKEVVENGNKDTSH